jgi:hypothetical protein
MEQLNYKKRICTRLLFLPGGTWHQRPPGIWPKAEGADIYTHAYDKVTRVKTNPELHNAGLGNWYIGECSLHSHWANVFDL